jgi:hypothetical protein
MEFKLDSKPNYRKSPYFSLADPALLKPVIDSISQTSTVETPKRKSNHTIFKDVFSEVNEMSDESQAKFLLALLRNGCFEPNWKAAAEDLGMNNGHNV